jgi:hypothetical protein
MGLFADWFEQAAPAWLQRANGAAYLRTIGSVFDAFVDGAEAAVIARFPEGDPIGGKSGKRAPIPGGQDALGAERMLPRIRMFVPAELDGPYGARLRAAWDDRAFSGSPEGLKRILAAIAATMASPWTATIYDHGGWNPWYSWARAWVLIQATPWVNDGVWSDPGTWGDGPTWGSSATPDQVQNFRAVVRSWCPPWARTDAVIALDGEMWGEPGTWADPGTWGGHAVTWPRLEA